jgi:hypothetical protein
MRRTLLFCLLITGFTVQSQNFLSWKYSDRYFTLALGTGSATYFGELNSNHRISTKPQLVSLGLEARLLNHFSARIEGAKYALEADDSQAVEGSFEQQRNLSFSSKNWEGTFQVIYYLKPYKGDYFRRWQWDPYVGLGAGISSYNPTTESKGTTYYLRELPTEPNKNYGVTTLIVPLTAGVKFKINDFTNLNLELGYRFTTTDYLDDVSTVYPDLSDQSLVLQDLANPKDLIKTVNLNAYNKMVPGAKRGDETNKDRYLFIMLKAEIYLPPNLFSGK